jgi:DNA-binding Lrp family transcriptional regulator
MRIMKRIMEKNLDTKDLEILNTLTQNKFFDKLKDRIVEELAKDCAISKKEVNQRINKMRQKLIIKGFSAIVDPVSIWDNLIFTFVKISLAPPLLEESLVEKYPSTWVRLGEILEEFVEKDEIASKILREAYALIGTEWDLLIITSTNDLSEHREMFERLSKKGFISMARSMFPIEGAPYIYDPISVPSAEELKQTLTEMKEYLGKT